jgi:hypothetical protein
MYFDTPRAWDNLPMRLSTEEISKPHEIIHEYFSAHDMPRARYIINKWLYSTCKNKRCKHSASGLFFIYEKTECLIEAAYLISQMDNKKREAVIIQKEGEPEINLMLPNLFCAWLSLEKTDNIPPFTVWTDFPRSLNYDEFLNPYIVFRKFFKYQSLGEWRQVMSQLFNMGLSRDNFLDDCLDIDILSIKKHLEKLVEAAHLIDVREFRQPYFNKITTLHDSNNDTDKEIDHKNQEP